MKSVRPAWLWLLVLFAASGCRTAGVDNLARRAPVAPLPGLDASAIVAEHNRNAERIESLEARPEIQVTTNKKHYPVSGRLAMERPRGFRLNITSYTMGDFADIGSNDEKFWFWVRDSKDKAVYFCNYEDLGSATLASALQPDWIVEALGLRVIPKDEAKEISVKRGEVPGTLVLTHRPTRTGGETVIRKTVISEANHRIQEHLLYSESMVPLARATVEGYESFPVADKGEETGTGTGTGAETVLIPRKLKLEWFREKLAMDVTLRPKSVNAQFDEKKRELFVEKLPATYARYNLARTTRAPSRGATSIRETRPAPPSGNGVQLGEPAPLDADAALRAQRDPVALSADLPALPSWSDQLVGPAIPRAPGPQFAPPATGTGWRTAVSSSFER